MFTHPYISGQLARERQRDMLARAEHFRLTRQVTSRTGTARQVGRIRPLRRAFRLISRPAAQS